MTLITRLITHNRTIFLADGRITFKSYPDPIVKTDSELKLIKISNGIIGLSGAADFGEYIPSLPGRPYTEGTRRFKVFDTLNGYVIKNNIKILNNQIIENIVQNLNDSINENHNGKYLDSGPPDINIFVSLRDINLFHFRILLNRSYNRYRFYITPFTENIINQNFDFDTNLEMEKVDFLNLLNEASNYVFQTDLNGDLLNIMSNSEIIEFGSCLYERYMSQFKNPTVGPLYMFEFI